MGRQGFTKKEYSFLNMPDAGLKKIIYLLPNFKYNGISKQVFVVMQALDKAKFLPLVCALYEDGPMAGEFQSLGIRIKVLMSNAEYKFFLGFEITRPRNIFYKVLFKISRVIMHWIVLVRLQIFLLKERPHIVHSYHFYANTLGRIAAFIAGVKNVFATETNTIKNNYTKFQTRVSAILSCLCKKVIAMSLDMKRGLVDLAGIDPGKIAVVYTTIDLSQIKIPQRKANGITCVGTVGTLEPRKGLNYFLESAKEVTESLSNVRFLIAGDGPLSSQLKNQAAQLGLTERVSFTGSFKDIADIMGQIDIFVLSAITDGLSATTMEAMAFQKAVVVSNVDALSEEVDDGVNGLMVPPRDPHLLAEALIRLIKDRDLALKFGKEARRTVEDKFDSGIIIKQLEALYLS